jgi:hypothetical protein
MCRKSSSFAPATAAHELIMHVHADIMAREAMLSFSKQYAYERGERILQLVWYQAPVPQSLNAWAKQPVTG